MSYLSARHPDMPGRDRVRKSAAGEHLQQLHLLDRLREIFRGLDIPWAVLKGMALACWLYDDPIERVSGDCDVLVRPDHEPLVVDALLKSGFRQTPDHRELFISDWGFVDLHTGFVNAERVRARKAAFPEDPRWFERIRAQSTPGGAIPTLSESDAAVYLTLHFVHHHGCIGARWLIDIAHLLDRLPRMAETVRTTSASGPLVLALAEEFTRGHGDAVDALSAPDRIIARAAYEGADLPGLRFLLTTRDIASLSGKASFVGQTLFAGRDTLRDVQARPDGAPLRHHLGRVARTARGLARLGWRVWRG